MRTGHFCKRVEALLISFSSFLLVLTCSHLFAFLIRSLNHSHPWQFSSFKAIYISLTGGLAEGFRRNEVHIIFFNLPCHQSVVPQFYGDLHFPDIILWHVACTNHRGEWNLHYWWETKCSHELTPQFSEQFEQFLFQSSIAVVGIWSQQTQNKSKQN